MRDAREVQGSLARIIRNLDHLYQGDLTHYFRVVFYFAQNLGLPYHNFRHMTHVTWLCYDACVFYRRQLTPRKMRNLLIAALFHDFDHLGLFGNDRANIDRAILGLRAHILPEDVPYLPEIEALIQEATEYPHQVPAEKLDLCGLILRDADVSQGLDPVWIQQVVIGLGTESKKTPTQMLESQEPFLSHVRFHSEWAQKRFPPEFVAGKIAEANELLAILTGNTAKAA